MAIASVVYASAAALSSPTTAGVTTTGANLLVAILAGRIAGTPTDLINGAASGNTWTGLTGYTNGDPMLKIWYVLSPAVGINHTFTAPGANVVATICVGAYSGVSAYDSQQNGATSASATSLATGSVTPSTNGCLVVAGTCAQGASFDGVTPTINSSLTRQTGQPRAAGVNFGGFLADYIQPTAGAINPTWTYVASADSLIADIAVFNPAAATRGLFRRPSPLNGLGTGGSFFKNPLG